MGKHRRRYTKEFKQECVEYLRKNEDKTITAIAEDLGIKRDMLSRWNQEYDKHSQKAFPGNGNPRDEEIFKLKKELAEVKEERDILKKAMAIFSKPQK